MRGFGERIAKKFPWFSARRCFAAFILATLLIVLIFPEAPISNRLVGAGVLVCLMATALCALTFWAKARIQIGRLKLRYRIIRRNAALAAVVGLSFFLVQRISVSPKSSSTAGISHPPVVAAPENRVEGDEAASPRIPSSATSTIPDLSSSQEAELKEARRFFCAFPEKSGDTESADATLVGHLQSVFRVDNKSAKEIAERAEAQRALKADCNQVLKAVEVVDGPERIGNASEASRAALNWCDGWYHMVKGPETTVEEAISRISAQFCTAGPHGEVRYCANGVTTEPTEDIAELLGIPWQQANADVVAGLASFDPHSSFYAACSELKKKTLGDPNPDEFIYESDTDLVHRLCRDYGTPVVQIHDFVSEESALWSAFHARNLNAEWIERAGATMNDFCHGPFGDAYRVVCAGVDRDLSAQHCGPSDYANYLSREFNVISRNRPSMTMTLADFCANVGA